MALLLNQSKYAFITMNDNLWVTTQLIAINLPIFCLPLTVVPQNEDRSDVGMGEEWEHEPGTNCSGIPTRTELVQGLCQ